MASLILMGIKHCGKSTQARILAKELALPFYDTDDVIEELCGKSPREIMRQGGQDAFYKAESDACRAIAERIKNGSAVIATGGGISCNATALDILHPLGKFIFLEADEKVVSERIIKEIKIAPDGSLSNVPAYIAKKNPHSIKDVRTIFHSFYEERTLLYSKIADASVFMTNASKEVNASLILETLKEF